MTKPRLNLSLTTVENSGLLVEERLSPCRQYVFTDPRGFYEWLCQQMGVNAKPDSPTHDGRVVVDANKLERLERLEAAATAVVRAWDSGEIQPGYSEILGKLRTATQ